MFSNLSGDTIVKFVDGPERDFVRIAGYCSYWRDVIREWKGFFKGEGRPHFAVPYQGNLYVIEHGKVIKPTPFGMFTPGHAGPPDNVLKAGQLRMIVGQPSVEDALGVYTDLGFPRDSFEHDILRNFPAHFNKDTGEIIINESAQHRFVASPSYVDWSPAHERSGYSIYLLGGDSVGESASDVDKIARLITEYPE